jgi:hypothetical protein
MTIDHQSEHKASKNIFESNKMKDKEDARRCLFEASSAEFLYHQKLSQWYSQMPNDCHN